MRSIFEISLDMIKQNWIELNKISNFCASAVVKADSYGFGMIQVAKALHEVGCNFFYVAQFEEAIKLRKIFKSKTVKIGIFEGFLNRSNDYQYYDLIPVINNLDQFNRFNTHNKNNKNSLNAILNFDTGMNRLGLDYQETSFILKNIRKYDNNNILFLMSHLTTSNKKNSVTNKQQLRKVSFINSYFDNKKISLSNTNGILLDQKYLFEQTRPGIGIYGVDSNGIIINKNNIKLNFPGCLKIPILQVRNVKKGEKISYGGLTKLDRDSRLATLGIGYADGILRLFRKNLNLKIKGKLCKIVGSITMDSIIIDVTEVNPKYIKIGGYLEIINEDFISNINLKKFKISIYELFTLLSNRINRIYV